MSDREELTGYVDLWWTAIESLLGLLERLDPDQWRRPTDLPGWDVHAVAAHVAHLEAILAGAPHTPVTFEPASHVRGLMGMFTEQGVLARRDRTPSEVIAEIRSSATARRAELAAEPPADGAAAPRRTFPGVPWDARTLLRNRVLDVWMHEQDIRRAVGLPGNLDSAAVAHTAALLANGLGLVLAKRAAAPPGSTLVVELDATAPIAFGVDESRRGTRLSAVPDQPTVRLRMSLEAFVLLTGGRRTPETLDAAVEVSGDGDLGQRILAGMSVTP